MEPRHPGCRGFSGYVDGELASFGGLVWTIDVSKRLEDGWLIERAVRMNVTSSQETFHQFEDVNVADSLALAELLPRLTDELVAVAPPT